jgi:hypothetical protein
LEGARISQVIGMTLKRAKETMMTHTTTLEGIAES